MKNAVTFGIVCLMASNAWAVPAPSLPADAKKLSLNETIKLLDGKTFRYTSYNHPTPMTGKTSFNFKKKQFSGTYQDNGVSKPYGPLDLAVTADGYCYAKECSQGSLSIYITSDTIFEVNKDGSVSEILKK